jgi:predicted nucleic acid-binding protein
MTAVERKYVVDTNLFIDSFRDATANAALQRFHAAFAPFEYLSAVVALELRAGTRRAEEAALQRNVFEPFERRGRLVTPTYAAWKRAGEVVAVLAERDGLELPPKSPAFLNDVLLAMSCRELGMILVTRNQRDFERIRSVAAFEFVQPWPAPSS